MEFNTGDLVFDELEKSIHIFLGIVHLDELHKIVTDHNLAYFLKNFHKSMGCDTSAFVFWSSSGITWSFSDDNFRILATYNEAIS